MIYQLSALWLLLSAAAAAELYDEVSDSENDVLYQQENVDRRPVAPQAEWNVEVSRLEDLLLFQLIKELMRKELQEEIRRSHEECAELEDLKNSVVKRMYPERNVRPQRRWKTKKGRYGTKVCYFKIC